VYGKGELYVGVPMGGIRSRDGTFFAHYEGSRLRVQVISGEVALEGKGRKGQFPILPGFENWLGRVNDERKAELGFPRSIHFRPLLELWATLHEGTREDFVKSVATFREKWVDAVLWSSEFNGVVSKRHLASEKAKQQEEKRRRRVIEAENRRFREMFYRKVFGE
jgi:hypothetical protein